MRLELRSESLGANRAKRQAPPTERGACVKVLRQKGAWCEVAAAEGGEAAEQAFGHVLDL